MNIRVDVEISPEEMRRLMGLPDVETFNRELMDRLRERMAAGAEGFDPASLMQTYVSSTMAGLDLFRRIMSAGASGGVDPGAREGQGR